MKGGRGAAVFPVNIMDECAFIVRASWQHTYWPCAIVYCYNYIPHRPAPRQPFGMTSTYIFFLSCLDVHVSLVTCFLP